MYEGVMSEILYTTKFDENSDIGTTCRGSFLILLCGIYMVKQGSRGSQKQNFVLL